MQEIGKGHDLTEREKEKIPYHLTGKYEFV